MCVCVYVCMYVCMYMMCTGKQSFEEIVEMSRKGDVKNVDLLVLGICGTCMRIYLHVCVYILCMYGCPTYTASVYAYTCLYIYVHLVRIEVSDMYGTIYV